MNNLANLDSFINQYNISMQLSKMAGEAVRAETEQEGIDRYKCRITRPGKKINVYVAASSEEGRLTPSDVLFMLILDASGCEMMKDYYGLHEQMKFAGTDGNLSEFDEFWGEYKSRCQQTQKFRAFLGNNLYDELIVKFGFKD